MRSSLTRTVVLVKEDQTYCFCYEEGRRQGLLAVLGRFAADAELNFSWRDAAMLAAKTALQSEIATTLAHPPPAWARPAGDPSPNPKPSSSS